MVEGSQSRSLRSQSKTCEDRPLIGEVKTQVTEEGFEIDEFMIATLACMAIIMVVDGESIAGPPKSVEDTGSQVEG